MSDQYDVIVVGSGAGGASVAYKLTLARQERIAARKRTVPAARRLHAWMCAKSSWKASLRITSLGLTVKVGSSFPGEFYNVGGKTKWYGAALFRFRPEEFEAEPNFELLGWPFGYDELEPYYNEASDLLRITTFKNEPQLQALLDKITTADPAWQLHPLPIGLSHDIVNHPEEAKHFDGFASPSGLKSDSERNLLDQIRDKPNLKLDCGRSRIGACRRAGRSSKNHRSVQCADGSSYHAKTVVLAAGAMSSPRILQDHLCASGFRLECGDLLGANFKMHINSAVLGFSPFTDHDVLRKTAVLYNDRFPPFVDAVSGLDRRRTVGGAGSA